MLLSSLLEEKSFFTNEIFCLFATAFSEFIFPPSHNMKNVDSLTVCIQLLKAGELPPLLLLPT